jgi:hypothetical protein
MKTTFYKVKYPRCEDICTDYLSPTGFCYSKKRKYLYCYHFTDKKWYANCYNNIRDCGIKDIKIKELTRSQLYEELFLEMI